MFKLSVEVLKAKKEEIKAGKKLNLNGYCLTVIHNTRYFTDIVYLTIDEAKKTAQKHADKYKRMKVTYFIKSGVLKGNIFNVNEKEKIKGEKKSNVITWS
jgi:riboflavin synthase alpha subunit